MISDQAPSQATTAVLHALRNRGQASVDDLVDITGLDATIAEEAAKAVETRGWARHRAAGQMSGWQLTADGRAFQSALAVADADGSDSVVEMAYRDFCDHNVVFKQICTDWQLRPSGELNDHSDASYDAQIVDRLAALERPLVGLLDSIAAVIPRFGRYASRFAAARARIAAGDVRAFTRPLSGSYHDIWMELHEDLLATLGRARSELDGH